MKLIDVLTKEYDVYDKTYDLGTCFGEIPVIDDAKPLFAFMKKLASKLEVVKFTGNDTLIVDFTKLINDNKPLFIDFMKKHWDIVYEDNEDFECEWIQELCNYVSGYVSNDIYTKMCNLLDKCK